MKTLLTLITLTSLIFISCAESEGNLSEIDGRGYSDPSRLVSTEWLESEIDNEEIPILDGSAKEFIDKILIAGIEVSTKPIKIINEKRFCFWIFDI